MYRPVYCGGIRGLDTAFANRPILVFITHAHSFSPTHTAHSHSYIFYLEDTNFTEHIMRHLL